MKKQTAEQLLADRKFDPAAPIEKEEDLVRIEDGRVIFRDRPDYPIELKRIRDAGQMVGWIYHLLKHGWITPQMLKAFISAVARHQKIEIDWHA